MSQQLRFIGIKGDECNCGRRASIRHCPSCGSARIYGYSYPQYHENINGVVEQVNDLKRCLGCGHKFTEKEREFCEAPAFGTALAKLRVQRLAEAKMRGEYLRPEEQGVADIIEKVQQAEGVVHEIPHVTSVDSLQAEPEVEALIESLPEVKHEHPGLTQAEYNVAERAFKLEWAQRKLMGQDTGIAVEEYVSRRMKGELIE